MTEPQFDPAVTGAEMNAVIHPEAWLAPTD